MSDLGLFEFLDSINTGTKNLIRDSEAPEVAEKLFPVFPVQRSMALHQDTVLYANEMNIRGLKQYGLRNRNHYEFYLHAVRKKKRFAKWDKPLKDETIQSLMAIYQCSHQKAEEINLTLTEEQVNQLIEKSKAVGGEIKTRKK